jgi:GMP synthase (glutamine-hydrolysing)
VGDQLVGVFVDTGMLRKNERQEVETAMRDSLGVQLVTVNAMEDCMDKLQGVTEPEQKRKIIGRTLLKSSRSRFVQSVAHSFWGRGRSIRM